MFATRRQQQRLLPRTLGGGRGRGETGRQGTQWWGTEGDRDRALQVGPTCQDERKIRAEAVLALILGRDLIHTAKVYVILKVEALAKS
jgi:hypothetical protein